MATDGNYAYTCVHCAYVVHRPGTAPPTVCPNCGKRGWSLTLEVTDHVLMPLEELDATAVNKNNEIVAERIEKQDRMTTASLASDAGLPSRINVERTQKVKGFDEEGTAAHAVAKAFNRSKGTDYVVEKKTEEDSEYADRVLVSKTAKPPRIEIQVRNLDAELIASLGKTNKFSGERSLEDWISCINTAITHKAQIDPALKAKVALVLTVPSALGKKIATELQSSKIDVKGFREVWLAPFHEDCFQVGAA